MESSNNVFTPEQQLLLKTLIYSDIFSFPLTKHELWKFLIAKKSIEKTVFEKALKELVATKQVVMREGYYCLAGKEESIKERKSNKEEVSKKLVIAEKASYYLSFIPSIEFIGLSGGLALGNATKEDDIDFFIITKKKTLFMTRLFILAILEWLHLRRKRNDKKPANKICINLLIDTTTLAWPRQKRDLYIAHEIVQMKPLFERHETYADFLTSNKWVKKFLPNAGEHFSSDSKKYPADYFTLRIISFFIFLSPLEKVVKKLQQKYMKKVLSTEIVTDTHLAFHPNDYRPKTMEVLRTKFEKLGLLTNF